MIINIKKMLKQTFKLSRKEILIKIKISVTNIFLWLKNILKHNLYNFLLLQFMFPSYLTNMTLSEDRATLFKEHPLKR